MTVDQMRVELERAYPQSFQWKERIKTWNDRRVTAVYLNFLETGRFEKNRKRAKKDGIQLRMDI